MFWDSVQVRWQSFAETVRSLCDISYFRQASHIAFIFLLVTLVTILGSSSLISNMLYNHVKEMVQMDMRVQNVLHANHMEEMAFLLKNRDVLEYRPERKVLLLDKKQKVVYGDRELLSVLKCSSASCQGWRHIHFKNIKGSPAELVGYIMTLDDGSIYFSAYDVLPMLQRVRILPLILGGSLFIMLLISICMSVRFGINNIRRVDTIRSVLKQYSKGNSAIRMPVNSQQDELDHLGDNINQALDRINLLMDELKSVSSHIAHELATPLTRLQNRLVSSMEMVKEPGVAEEISYAIEEVGRIRGLSKSILRVGEIESGRCQRQFVTLQVIHLIREAVEYYQPLAEIRNNKLHIDADPTIELLGDRALLMQALSNLIDNALKYAPENTPMTIFAHYYQSGYVDIGVSDHGPGIPEDLRKHALKRFKRLNSSEHIQGYGLGLALVQAIVKLHQGTVHLTDRYPDKNTQINSSKTGLTVILRLPVSRT